jgi:hypothetical protein
VAMVVPLSASRMTFPPREVFDVARRDRSAPCYLPGW